MPGFQTGQDLADETRLTRFLPKLTALAGRERILIVIDNIGSLLSNGGQWHDERWGHMVEALGGHVGLGRLVLTSRRLPEDFGGTRLQMEAVGTLSLKRRGCWPWSYLTSPQ